jgi:hypothetical protein
VYIETLKRLQELFPALGLTDSIDTLANEWDRFVAKHNTDVQLPKSARQAPAFVSHMIQQAVLDIIPRIVPAEISSLDELASVSPWPQRTAWASGAWPSDFVAPELTAEPPAALDETAARQMIEDLLPNGATRVVPAAEWRTMLDFGGWLDKGPEGGKAH